MIRADVCVIAATSRNLEAAVAGIPTRESPLTMTV
jgi:transcriptional regulator with GAF, ATPase, and Fis domain